MNAGQFDYVCDKPAVCQKRRGTRHLGRVVIVNAAAYGKIPPVIGSQTIVLKF